MQTILAVFLVGLTLLAISVQRTYRRVSLKELKRRASEGHELSKVLYRAGSYGSSLDGLLWLIIGLSSAAFFVLLSKNAPFWFAFAGCAALLWYGFAWKPVREVGKFGEWLASRLAPSLGWLLNYLHPVLAQMTKLARKIHPVHVHTGLYEKSDLIELLERQAAQPDNRIHATELTIAHNALQFGEKLVEDVLVPRRIVKMVSVDELVGPLLMSELHDSGFSRFPVYGDKKDHIVGTLYLRDLVNAKGGGTVRRLMREEVAYIHEEQSLLDALKAILKTRQHLFIVVNNFEEYVGVISIEDVLEQIIGEPIVDEFDRYDDMRAVAAYHARKEHKNHQHIDEEIELE
ncbi:MAG: exported protein of unknown function [Candidatus Saccharibacteria bacterium]|nr:exported protein of unknown function [Candidatus Saccharibacteria bacterium]